MDPVALAVTFFSTKIWDPIALKVACIVDAGDRVNSMVRCMDQLRDKSVDIQNRVSAAQFQLLIPTQEVDGWLRQVRILEAEVNKINRDFRRQIRCLCSCPSNPSSTYRIGRRAAQKISEVNEMLAKAYFEVVATKSNPEVAIELPTISAVGIEPLMEDVLRYLFDEETGTVGIHGMGGVGKTTLLRSINNLFVDRASEFDHVIMVEAFPEFKIEHLQQAIAERVGLRLSEEDAKVDSRAIEIFKCLKGKKFLLLLDNLWDPINLIKAGIPTRQSKCKVVIASRLESICGQMGAEKRIKMDILSPEKAWELFRQKLGDLVKNPDIEHLAKLVAEDCNGLPLALVVVAATLSARTTREEWQYAVRLMKNMHLDSLIPENVSIIPILQLSYDSLSSDQLKLCFLSCSFYPKGHSIPKDELIECWMGLGFLEEHNDIDEDYERGHFLIGKLREASLLEAGDDEKHVKMHDIIRGLALNLTSAGLAPQLEDKSPASGNHERFWVVQPGIDPLTSFPDKFLEGSPVERMSLMHKNIDSLPEKSDFPILSTLMLQSNVSLTGIFSQGFFNGTKCLKYLDLSNTSVSELCGINQLSFLEHLNLSRTHIHELTEELGYLRRLKYFYLMHTHNLRVIHRKLPSCLQNLRVFNIYGSSYQLWETDGDAGVSTDTNRASLNELDQLTRLKALGISIGTPSAFQKIFYMSIPTKYLYVSSISNPLNPLQFPSTIRLRSKINTSLLEITIKSCKELEELMIGEEIKQEERENTHKGSYPLCSLEILYLSSLHKLSKITWKEVKPTEYFPKLRFLSIDGCHKLGSITWVLQLPCLEKLHISECCGFQQVIARDDESLLVQQVSDSYFFPRLKILNLIDLPGLTSIYQHTLAFPYLVSLHVLRCPKLVSLPFGQSSGYHLQEIRGSKDWWSNLNWANNNMRVSFSKHFKEAAS